MTVKTVCASSDKLDVEAKSTCAVERRLTSCSLRGSRILWEVHATSIGSMTPESHRYARFFASRCTCGANGLTGAS